MEQNSFKLPHFIIVGSMKSGTSTLAHYLSIQDGIFMPKDEMHFFDATGTYANRWEKGLYWYGKQFQGAKESDIIGEKTPTYCYLQNAPERIKNTLPEVKLIWIFRNPVDRAYSNYWHAVRTGAETESFKYAIENEEDMIKKNIFKGYSKRSLYIEQVESYLKYFDIDRMYFLTLKSLKNNLDQVLVNIGNFLGANIQQVKATAETKKKNQSYFPKYMGLRRFTYNVFGKRSIISKVERKINKKRTPWYPPMEPELRKLLVEKFKEPNKNLRSLTGLDLSDWGVN